MGKGKARPAKRPDLLKRARELLSTGKYRDTRHAADRRQERGIILPEIQQVIEGGWNEKSKDEFKVEWSAWNYAIRGKTVDRRELRVAIAFVEEDSLLIIVTAIDLQTERTR
ncbi:MAG: DUF4258 domain-containing protein [Nitrospiraceae bacterium]